MINNIDFLKIESFDEYHLQDMSTEEPDSAQSIFC